MEKLIRAESLEGLSEKFGRYAQDGWAMHPDSVRMYVFKGENIGGSFRALAEGDTWLDGEGSKIERRVWAIIERDEPVSAKGKGSSSGLGSHPTRSSYSFLVSSADVLYVVA